MQPIWILLPTIAGVALIVWLWMRRRERERDAAMLHFARTRGFEYRETVENPGFDTHLFRRGHRRRFRNVLSRTEADGETLLFDYRYVERHGKNSSVEQQTVAAFRRRGPEPPELELRPENMLHRIGSLLGWGDIDFDHRPEFSRRYLLRGPDERPIRDAFGPTAFVFFERNPGWSVEVASGWVVVYRARRRVKPDELSAFLDETAGVDRALRGDHR